ncbi:MAG: hypothetical protein WC222_11645 [Parachlamydiales bacterium]|jgi:hypothetical protein
MKTKISNLRAQLKYEYSPFIFTDSSLVTILKDNRNRITSRGGEMIRSRELSNTEFVDEYVQHICKWISLINPAKKMLTYILTIMQERNEQVIIDIDRALAFTGYSSDVSIYDGLNDLVNHQIIARSMTPFMFYVNTRYIIPDNMVQFSERIIRNKQAISEKEKMQDINGNDKISSGDMPGPDNKKEQKEDLYQMLLQKEKK